MRAAFIGNSHLGRIKREWDLWCREHPGIDHEYYIHRSMGTHPLRIGTDGTETAFSHIGLLEDKVLDPGQYDAVVVMGMSLGIQRVFELAYRFRRPDMPGEGGYLLSAQTWEGALDDIISNTDAAHIVRAVRRDGPDTRIIMVPQGHPLEWINTRNDFRLKWSEWAREHELERLYGHLYQEALSRFAAHTQAEVLAQPDRTVASLIWTRSEFGLAQEEDPSNPYWPKNDYFHMNDLYARQLAPQLHELLLENSSTAA